MSDLDRLAAHITPGPWRLEVSGDACYVNAGEVGLTCCIAAHYKVSGKSDGEANAAAIAVLPELVAVAQAAEALNYGLFGEDSRRRLADALVALHARLEQE